MAVTQTGIIKAIANEIRKAALYGRDMKALPDMLDALCVRIELNNAACDDRQEKIRQELSNHGNPICVICGSETNPAYKDHPKLTCWNCGAVMWNTKD